MSTPTIGRNIYTWRYTSVDAVTGQAITIPASLPRDIMSLQIHVEGSTAVMHIVGEDFDDSATAIITSDGTTFSVDVGKSPGETACTVLAPSGTVNVSVIALSRFV
jgi:hypothetical protein